MPFWSPVPYLRPVVGGWTGEAAVRSEEVPGKKDSASMAVKGERDPAARAHIHPTSSRKPAVAEATLLVGGAATRAPLQRRGREMQGMKDDHHHHHHHLHCLSPSDHFFIILLTPYFGLQSSFP